VLAFIEITNLAQKVYKTYQKALSW